MMKQKENKARTIPAPDASISIKDMHDYGYLWDGMLPEKYAGK